MGVVSGIVLSYQFGTNWSRFSVFAGNIVGPLIGYEVLTAFFLEATFLGIMLFGWGRVPRWLQVIVGDRGRDRHHDLRVLDPGGQQLDAHARPATRSSTASPCRSTGGRSSSIRASPTASPTCSMRRSSPPASWCWRSGARYCSPTGIREQARTMIKMAVLLLAVLAPLQLLIGDQHGLNTLKHQPIKIAAMEAHWDSDEPVDFHIFAWPDEKAEKNDWALSIPNAGSLILTHRLNGLIIGLKDVAPQNRPPVKTVFFAFRIMLAIGFFMIAAALIGAWLLWRGMLFETRWYLRIVAHSLVDRLRRRHRRLGGDRKRPPALGGAGHAAHRRRHLAARRADGADHRWCCSSSSMRSYSRWASTISID